MVLPNYSHSVTSWNVSTRFEACSVFEVDFKEDIFHNFSANTDQVQSNVINLLATKDTNKVTRQFAETSKRVFNADEFTIDENNREGSVNRINQWAASSTKNRITKIVRMSK